MQRNATAKAVLVVEDDWLICDELVHELGKVGCTVKAADTAECAIEHLRDMPGIDVVLTDIHLAGRLSGWDVAEVARALSPNVKVIYVSGNSADRKRQVSNSRFFSKPYDVAKVVKACVH